MLIFSPTLYVTHLGILVTSGSYYQNTHPLTHGKELTKLRCLHGGKDQPKSNQTNLFSNSSWRPLLPPQHLSSPKPSPPWTKISKRSVPTVSTPTATNSISSLSAANPVKAPTASTIALKQLTNALAPASGRPQGGKLLRFLQLQIMLIRASRPS